LIFTDDGPPIARLHLPEYVTLHELGHQFFYGLVASDEVEEAWLDEGLTETATGWALDRMFGAAGGIYDLGGHRLSALGLARLAYLALPDFDPVTTRAFEFRDFASYGAITYHKTALALDTIRSEIGDERFFAGMRRYYEAGRFHHPRGADFRREFDAGAGGDLSALWAALLDGTTPFDDQVASVVVRPDRRPSGLFPSDGGVRERDEHGVLSGTFESEVLVERRGALPLPTEVEVRFDDGSTLREHLPADGRVWHRLRYDGPHKVVTATVDPERRRTIDRDRLDDAARADPAPWPRRAILHRLALLVHLILSVLS
jgi:hypothetical protein